VLLGQFSVAGISYSWYHFLLIGLSVVFGGSLVWLVRGTRFGKLVVAVIHDREISVAVGINVNRLYTVAFTLGALSAAVGGALIAPTISVVPGFAVDVTVLAFAVIAIGGMGSLEGVALGELIVGLPRALAIHLMPELELGRHLPDDGPHPAGPHGHPVRRRRGCPRGSGDGTLPGRVLRHAQPAAVPR
jgi:branched-chain amino acid transport system permease protein